MSLLRPLGRAARARPLAQAVTARYASNTPSAPTPSSSDPSNPSSSDPSDALYKLHTPSYPMHPVPRSPSFPMPRDAPLHKTVNYPSPAWGPVEETFDRYRYNGDNSQDTQKRLAAVVGYKVGDLRRLEKAAVVRKRVVKMTKLGKIPSQFVMMVVGDPEKGMVGIGRGRGDEGATAVQKAFDHAILNMDYVHKLENRTLWGQGKDLKYKVGATTVIMRARPAGFGLQVPHVLHRVLSACGIRDASATIEGSRNPLNVLNAAIQILHGGFGPPGFGSGDGRGGRMQDKKAGMRSIRQIELERGRHGVDIGKRV